ncbi:importin subunit alpha-4-like [Gossypium australe]|uniref:Importin subunit alpha n=1 Tax=Gossypium australe TaxID=47621 RepID=A0A5B6UCM2_9ROSI|nr:importin subunit alpha-4-like [Gossypium australe]
MPLRPSNTRKEVEVRKKGYKTLVLDGEEARRRREDNLVVIRKSKRENSLLKKRKDGFFVINHSLYQQHSNLECVPLMVKGVSSDNPALQLEATTLFRKLLSVEPCPPIEQVIEAGIVPRLVEFLDNHDQPQLQFEAAWALTNIASGTSEHTHVVIQNGAVPKFVQLLCSSIADVREQAVWALGNIAGDSPKSRDIVLNHGGLIPLLAQLNQHSKLSLLRNATWALLNFCRGKPPAPFHQVKPALQVLHRLIESSDEEILTDACWALSYISDAMSEKIQAVIEAGICPRLVELLHHPSEAVVVPALRTVGNIVTGDDSQTQAVIEANIISPLVHLLQHAELEIKKEAAWAIFNAISIGSHEQIQYLVKQGCMKPLCDLLACSDPRIVTLCLEGLDNILKIGEADKTLRNNGRGGNIYTEMIEECDGLEKIENLQSHENNEIYNKAVHMLERYWLEEKEEEEEDHFGDSQFSYGINTASIWRFKF